MFLAEDLPLFPVDNNLLNSIKERVKVARDLDKCQLQVKRANTETGWIEKAAQEMDILVDDNKLYPFHFIILFLIILAVL